VAQNCAALPDTLLESELFGHKRGAFTGAHVDKKGLFEVADGGTLLLDEVSETSGPFQAKLLRALQERTIERLGGVASIEVNARIVAATNRDLEASIEAGTFRSDLFYRINVVPMVLPPLRARREDIPLLVENVLKRVAREGARPIEGLSPDTWEVLAQHTWPGNVRELENAIERAATLADGPILEPADLPDAVTEGARVTLLRDQVRTGRVGFEDAVARFESELLREALEATDWNQTRAADRLGITRRLLKLRMDRCGLVAPDSPGVAQEAY
jgi:transcriptional regulator with PAS, ATPase and Fis domain